MTGLTPHRTDRDVAGEPMRADDDPDSTPPDSSLPDSSRADSNAPDSDPPNAGPIADVDAEHLHMWSLVRAAQHGSPDAFGEIYDHYVEKVFKFIYYRVGDRTVAEDLTSETFLRALRSISSISYQGRDIGAWLTTIARNIALDHMTSARSRWEIGTAELAENGLSLDSAEVTVLSQLTNERLREAIGELSDEQQECIVLRFMNGLSVAETAQAMGKNEGSVKGLQHRAVKRLADVVAEELR